MNVVDIHQYSIKVSANQKLLDNIDFKMQAGELVIIIGPNGAGKSSLLNAISGEFSLGQSEGEVLINGKPHNQWSIEGLARHLAYLPQLSLLNFPYRVEEVVALGRTPHASGIAADQQIVEEAMQAMDVIHLRDHLYPQLSGGEKQRVHLARVFAQIWRAEDSDKRLLLLDEPTSALDIGHQHILMKKIKGLVDKGVAVLAVMHDFSLASQYADRLVAMANAVIVDQGPVEKVFTESLISQLFDVHAEILRDAKTGKPVVFTSARSLNNQGLL